MESIKNRKSYKDFSDLALFLKENRVPPESIAPILRKVLDILDKRQSFGSQKNMLCAQESLTFLMKEKGLV